MKFDIGAMSVGDILDRGLKILLSRLPTFYLINLIVFAPVLLFQLALPAMLTALEAGEPSPLAAFGFLGGGLMVMVLQLVLGTIGAGAILHVIGQEFIDRKVGIAEAMAFAMKRFFPLLGGSLMVSLLTVVGCCFFIVPGVIFMVWYIFVAQIIVMENLGAIEAMARSKELVSGFFWRALGVLALLVVISFLLGLVSNVLARFFPGMEVIPGQFGPQVVFTNYYMYLLNVVVSFLVKVLAQSYTSVCVTLFYFDLRIRKEGFDLELAARRQAGQAGERKQEPALPEPPEQTEQP